MRANDLKCSACSAIARDTSKERGRFMRRHPKICRMFLAQMARVLASNETK